MVVLTSFIQPNTGVRHCQPNTSVHVNENNLGKGTLYIAESRLSWISSAGDGFSVDYPHICLHAVSRDLNAFPQECLYLMLDTALGEEDNIEVQGDSNENECEEGTTEMRFVPDDKGMLDAMFHAMNVCQALHPDPADSASDEDFYEAIDDQTLMEEADFQMAGLIIGNHRNGVQEMQPVEAVNQELTLPAEIEEDMWDSEEESDLEESVGLEVDRS